jgi:site-specific recombinase XerD
MSSATLTPSLATLAATFPGLLELAGTLSASTLLEYRRDAALYLAWCGDDRQTAQRPETLRAWRTHLVDRTRVSPNTINRRVSSIKRLIHAGARAGQVPADVAFAFSQVELVKVAPLRTRLNPHARVRLQPGHVRRLCQAPDPRTLVGLRDRALLATFASSGCRLAEVVTLEQSQIVAQQEGWLLYVWGKGQAEPRGAPLSDEAHTWIQRWLAARKPHIDVLAIFTGFVGPGAKPIATPLSRRTAWETVKKYAKLEGLPHVKPHDFRRFVGTQVHAKHGLRAAQHALGHKRLETTAQHYVLDELKPGLTDGLY